MGRTATRLAAWIVIATVAFGSAVGTASAGSRWNLPGYRKCGTFHAQYRIHVYAKHLSCRRARRIQKEYWLAPDSRKVSHHGGYGAAGWITLKRFPGWKCTSGSGGGACAKGRRQAAYQN
jgi:hypothetical protein